MPSFGPDGAEIHGDPVTVVSSAARTANGTGGTIVAGDRDTLRLALAVTAASGGTPSLTVTVEHSGDGTTWSTHSSFTAVTTTGTTRKVFGGVDRYVRATWTITGTTPSFTFSVTGELV